MTNMTSINALSTAGMRGSKLDADSEKAMAKAVRLYLSPTRPAKSHLYRHYRASVIEENANRVRDGILPLLIAGESTFNGAISRLDSIDVAVARHGVKSVGGGHAPRPAARARDSDFPGSLPPTALRKTSQSDFSTSCQPELIETHQAELSALRAHVQLDVGETLATYVVAALKRLGVWRRLSAAEKEKVREAATAWEPRLKH